MLMGVLGSLVVALLWTTLAALNPTTNYHLSPLVAVIAAPAAARMATSGRLRWPIAIVVVGVGLIITVAAAIIIHVAGWARGPSFSSTVTPLAELIAVIAVGALVGAVIAGGEAVVDRDHAGIDLCKD
ncbi:hypothetical protein ADILRU_1023 [Leifsonia rubra CMS 76R]|nr:hypothetical protein ADILRU_1023 [Leifsonia rubra CMS 76R]